MGHNFMITIKNPEGFKFEESEHRYTFNGAPILSITQILRDVGLSPDFGAMNQEVLRQAAIRGTNVHSLCQFFDEDDLGEVDPAYRGYLDAWIEFRFKTGFIPEIREQMAYHPVYRFGGRPDAAGIIGDKYVIVEIKSGEGPTLHDSIGLQLAAQVLLIEDVAKYGPIKTRLAVKLHSDGTYVQREYKDRNDRGVFLAAATCANWKQGRK